MRKLLVVAVGVVAGLSVGAAAPKPDVWSCWHSISGDKEGAEPLVLVRDGDKLVIRDAEFLEYQILQDNELGLVAVRSYAEANDALKHLGADVFVIDKKTRQFRKSNVFVEGARADNTPRRGKCDLQ